MFIPLLLFSTLKLVSSQRHPTIPSFVNEILDKIDDLSVETDSEPELSEFPEIRIFKEIFPSTFPLLKLFSSFSSAPSDLLLEYDFIIVGSGPAGCVLANRLSENPEINVLLLEAGPRPSLINTVPGLATFALLPEMRWDFVISPYPGSCLGYKGQVCSYTLGKALGGSSAINHMIYARGNRHDFDRWQRMGNYGWAFDDLLPLFVKMENATELRHPDRDIQYRGLDGEISVSHTNHRTLISDMGIEAAKERGLPRLDFNGPNQIGVDYTQATIKNGRRFSAVEAYLDPVTGRKNLHVMVNSLVSKVMIDPVTKFTQGVEFIYSGETIRISVKKEVILSAGPIMSPTLLMLSGVGPRRDLRKFNIPLMSDLPVGRKYLDHTSISRINARTKLVNETIDLKRITTEDVEEFVNGGEGRLTVPATDEVILFTNNGMNDFPAENANAELIIATGRSHMDSEGFTQLRDDIFNATYRQLEDEQEEGLVTLTVFDLYPQTAGRIRLRGNSINHLPIIEFPFFRNKADLDVLVAGAKEAMALMNTEAMRSVGARLVTTPLPDCAKLVFGSDGYWKCFIRHMARNSLHAAATNKMGPRDDREAVVDPQLKVYGVGKLRVADTSIAPTTTACHTQALSYVIGEKLAEMLKKEWKL